ncbi:DUF2147 domain-containing protein [Mucilaginibacter sp.]|uniref:DUF2147 domain-containing protein n=1 Tax=Mucilaginibacter sp. TaxID=1882438 RepID=UPI00261130BC|nr:DUF2147 domain-containing protein [Mucilaginibacter sp.]
MLLFFLTGFAPKTVTVNDPNRICGKWISSEKNLIVQVYKDGETFKAKLVWYDNIDKTKAMDEWADIHNPNPALRTRKLIGMSIVSGMNYIPKSNSWEDGKIYDAKTGHEWSASVHIDNDGKLKVTGYWHFKFIGRTMTFTRV